MNTTSEHHKLIPPNGPISFLQHCQQANPLGASTKQLGPAVTKKQQFQQEQNIEILQEK